MENIICNWCTYKRSQCRRNILHESYTDKKRSKFCKMHDELIKQYSIPETLGICDTQSDEFIIPRSFMFVKSKIIELSYDMSGSFEIVNGKIREEADISNEEYILLLADNTKCYYTNPKSTKSLKLVLKRFCKNKAEVMIENLGYCEECFMKLNGVPKLSCLK